MHAPWMFALGSFGLSSLPLHQVDWGKTQATIAEEVWGDGDGMGENKEDDISTPVSDIKLEDKDVEQVVLAFEDKLNVTGDLELLGNMLSDTTLSKYGKTLKLPAKASTAKNQNKGNDEKSTEKKVKKNSRGKPKNAKNTRGSKVPEVQPPAKGPPKRRMPRASFKKVPEPKKMTAKQKADDKRQKKLRSTDSGYDVSALVDGKRVRLCLCVCALVHGVA